MRVFVVVAFEHFFGVVVGVGATLAMVELWWWDPFGGAVVAFSGYRDRAVTASAYQAIYAAYPQVNSGFGPVMVRGRYGRRTGPIRPQTPG